MAITFFTKTVNGTEVKCVNDTQNGITFKFHSTSTVTSDDVEYLQTAYASVLKGIAKKQGNVSVNESPISKTTTKIKHGKGTVTVVFEHNKYCGYWTAPYGTNQQVKKYFSFEKTAA